MQTIAVHASKNYEVQIGTEGLAALSKDLCAVLSGHSCMLVSDDNVYPLYGAAVTELLSSNGCRVHKFVFSHGEAHKCITTYSELLETMCSEHITRKDYVIALGGGVVGDLAGFAAATYQRGIGFIQLPTSLLAAVDSSVGGKTAVDLAAGKNQVGAFYQPSLVVCDISTLSTLPEDEYQNGCAEIIKYAMIGSRSLFNSLAATPVRDQYEAVIAECVAMKRDYVEQDEHDLGLRMMLNFGHTAGHAVEAASNYQIAHGRAVAIGMAIITKAAVTFGLCSASVYDELVSLLVSYGLPTTTDYTVGDLIDAALSDKKITGKKMTLVVPVETGKCILKEIETCEFKDWLIAGGIEA